MMPAFAVGANLVAVRITNHSDVHIDKVLSKTAPYFFYVRGQKRPAVKNGGQKRLRTNSTYVSAVFDRFAHFL